MQVCESYYTIWWVKENKFLRFGLSKFKAFVIIYYCIVAIGWFTEKRYGDLVKQILVLGYILYIFDFSVLSEG